MNPARVIVVSDSHLSPRAEDAEANWSAVVAHVAAAVPDLVIHLGDLSLDGAGDPEDLRYGRAQLDRLPVPWLAVPGNHDIGDNPSPVTPAAAVVDPDRCRRWIDLLGADHWSVELGGWNVVAVNAQLFGSGMPEEAEQWDWLSGQLQQHIAGQPIALVTHKPLLAGAQELADAPPYRFVPPRERRRLSQLFLDSPPALELVLSGHVHQYRVLDLGDVAHVWAPTTWAVLPDDAQPTFGIKRCGAVAMELAEAAFMQTLIEPVGTRQLTIGHNTSDPYSLDGHR